MCIRDRGEALSMTSVVRPSVVTDGFVVNVNAKVHENRRSPISDYRL